MSGIIQAKFNQSYAQGDLAALFYRAKLQLAREKELQRLLMRQEMAIKLRKYRKQCQSHSKAQASKEFNLAYRQKLVQATQGYRQAILLANKDCLRLALRVAKQIIGENLNYSSAYLTRAIRSALKKISKSAELTLLVNPQDRDKLQAQFPAAEWSLNIRANPQIGLGCAVIEGTNGAAKIDWQADLEKLSEILCRKIEQHWSEKCCY